MTQEAYRERFGARLHKTEERLTQLCDAYLPAGEQIGAAARYSLLGGGKRVRAVL